MTTHNNASLHSSFSTICNNRNNNIVHSAKEHYIASNSCKRVLFAMCLGIKSEAGDVPLIVLEKVPWCTIRRKKIKPSRIDLVDEINRRCYFLHNDEPTPRAANWSVTACLRWLMNNPIQSEADIAFLRHEVSQYHQLLLTSLMQSRQGDTTNAVARAAAAAASAPADTLRVVTTTAQAQTCNTSRPLGWTSRKSNASIASEDDDDESSKLTRTQRVKNNSLGNKNDNSNNFTVTAIDGPATTAVRPIGNAASTTIVQAAGAATVLQGNIGNVAPPPPPVPIYRHRAKSPVSSISERSDRDATSALTTAVVGLINAIKTTRGTDDSRRQVRHIQRRIEILRDRCREYRRDAFLTTNNNPTLKTFYESEVDSMMEEIASLQQERQQLERKNRTKNIV